MTAKKDSLKKKEVLRSVDIVDGLLSHDNVDEEALKKFIREVADYIKLPSSCEFMTASQGRDDVSIFDFSK